MNAWSLSLAFLGSIISLFSRLLSRASVAVPVSVPVVARMRDNDCAWVRAENSCRSGHGAGAEGVLDECTSSICNVFEHMHTFAKTCVRGCENDMAHRAIRSSGQSCQCTVQQQWVRENDGGTPVAQTLYEKFYASGKVPKLFRRPKVEGEKCREHRHEGASRNLTIVGSDNLHQVYACPEDRLPCVMH